MAATITLTEQPAAKVQSWTRLGGRIWHASAGQALSRRCRPGEAGPGWDAWSQHLSRRKKPTDLATLLPGKRWPLAWALPDELVGTSTADLIARLATLGKKKQSAKSSLPEEIRMWLIEARDAPVSPAFGLECVALAHAAPKLSGLLSPQLWWELIDQLIDTAHAAGKVALDSDPLSHQLIAGELALAFAYLFPELIPCRELWATARENLSAGVAELLDGEGMPHGKYLHLLRPLLALWTRSAAIAEAQHSPCFSDQAQSQYCSLVRCALVLARRDGSQLLSRGSAGAWQEDLFRHAIELGGDEQDRKAARLTLPGQKSAAKRPPRGLPAPTANSEWSGVAVLRNHWSKSSSRLAVNYSARPVELELEVAAGLVFSGVWDYEVRIDGRRLVPDNDWEDLCWVSDDDVDYLELEIDLESGVRLGRQMLLAREDRFLLLADVILADSSHQIDYVGKLPLADGVRFEPAGETREGILAGAKMLGSVMPLALPEWRVDPRHGTLAAAGKSLELRQSAEGSALYCPLFIDLDPRRVTRPLTWRQLTVGCDRIVQPRDVAAGFRVQCGRQQWLIYRSLAKPANRTVLGHNLVTEFLIAGFDRDGTVESLLEIE